MTSAVIQFILQNPEASVALSYALAVAFNYIDYEPPIIGQIDAPLLLAGAVSLWYQFVVPTPETGLQSLMDSITHFVGFSVFVLYFVKRALDVNNILK